MLFYSKNVNFWKMKRYELLLLTFCEKAKELEVRQGKTVCDAEP